MPIAFLRTFKGNKATRVLTFLCTHFPYNPQVNQEIKV